MRGALREELGTRRKTMQSMKLRAQLACITLLLGAACAPARAAQGSVSGVVRDSAGVPQMGAQVQLIRADLSVVSSVYTNAQGQFAIASILPGRYALKAMGASFLPSLREDVRIRNGRTVVNLTLNTLYEVIQWLPAEPRSRSAQKDDWEWTLRSAADRPLLRWLEDGPLVVVSDGKGSSPRLKARLMATGQAGTFGESGERITASIADTPRESRELLAQVDFAPGSNGSMESMLGFEQDLGYVGSVQSVAAFAIEPSVVGAGSSGIEEWAFENHESLRFSDSVTAEAGAVEALVGASGEVLALSLPFAQAAWRSGNDTVHYRFATQLRAGGESGRLPRVATADGRLTLEHGVHQELGWERRSSTSAIGLEVFASKYDTPVLEGSARWAAGASPAAARVLFDPASGLFRRSVRGYSSSGVEATAERRLPGNTLIRAMYATGKAVVMPALPSPMFEQAMAELRPRRVQTYAISLSGTLEGTGTHWRASYRWQPEDAISDAVPFDSEAMDPYLNVQFRQRLARSRQGSVGLEAMIDMRNVLSEGYRPYLLSDGTMLIFAADQRALRAGVAITF